MKQTRKVDDAILLLRDYAPQAECVLEPLGGIREWHQGRMSSRKLIVLLEGAPSESWFKASLRADFEELVGDATVGKQNEVREMTEALLRGEVDVRWSEIPLRK